MKSPRFTKSACLAMATTLMVSSSSHAQTNGQRSTPAQLVDALHAAFGEHHARAVHAKGIIMEGKFTPASSASTLLTAFHLQKKSSMVIVRFSDFTGIPDIPDNSGLANPRGLAIKFKLDDGASTDIVGHSFDGFPTSNSDQFRELLLAISKSGPDAAKPTELDNFLATHPVAKTFLTIQKTPSSYASINYFGVNAFKFTNKDGVSHFIRYQFVPEQGEQLLNEKDIAKAGSDYLQNEIKTRIAKGSIKFKLFAQVAEAGDNTDDPSIAWPASRKKILLGTVEITKPGDNTSVGDKALSFSPNNVPAGIETADPMLNFRSKAYPISVKERQ